MTRRPLLLACLLGVFLAPPALGAPRVAAKPAVAQAKSKAKSKAKRTPVRATKARPPSRGKRVAARASGLVGRSLANQAVTDDCSGLVRLAYQAVGVELLTQGSLRPGENAASAMYRRAQRTGALHRKTPRPGDIVFFHETYDRNRDGLRNDGVTHVGVIESVAKDGTVVFVHRGGQGVARARMNLRQSQHKSAKGHLLNDYLRRAEQGERARLTGELFVGYGSAQRLTSAR